MARPRKTSDDKQSDRIVIRVTRSEKAHVKQIAAGIPMTLSEYGRLMLFNGKIEVRQPDTLDARTFAELSAIGNNLNQMARRFNATDHPPPPHFSSLLDRLDRILTGMIAHGSANDDGSEL